MVETKVTWRLRVLGLAFGVLAPILTVACEVIPSPGPAPDQFVLSSWEAFTAPIPVIKAQLVVEEPLASRAIDTDRIALQPAPNEFKYFAGVRWVDRAPKMIQMLLVESFENTGKIDAVGRQAVGLRADYNLKWELRQFQAEYFNGETIATARVRLSVKVVKQPRASIVGSKSVTASAKATGTNTRAVIKAFEQALGEVLEDTVAWTLNTIAASEPP